MTTIDEITQVVGDGKIILASGRWFDVFDPKPEDVDIKDIAHALSNLCRFTGHTTEFYSVAQHSVLVSYECDQSDALVGLLHDASEAYLSDIARPIKKHPDFGPIYLKMEDRISGAINSRFCIEEITRNVKDADDLLLRTEARDLMPETFPVYPGDTLPYKITGWPPQRAKEMFLQRFDQLT